MKQLMNECWQSNDPSIDDKLMLKSTAKKGNASKWVSIHLMSPKKGSSNASNQHGRWTTTTTMIAGPGETSSAIATSCASIGGFPTGWVDGVCPRGVSGVKMREVNHVTIVYWQKCSNGLSIVSWCFTSLCEHHSGSWWPWLAVREWRKSGDS